MPPSLLEDNPELAEAPINDLDGQPELDAATEDEPEEVVIPKPVSKKKHKVVANRAGYIHNERKVAGQEFEVHEHQLGSWMDCKDPVMHKKHLANIKAKTQKINKKAIAEQEEENAAGE